MLSPTAAASVWAEHARSKAQSVAAVALNTSDHCVKREGVNVCDWVTDYSSSFFLKDKSQSGLGSAGVDPGYSAAARVICPQYRQGVNCIVAMTTLPKE